MHLNLHRTAPDWAKSDALIDAWLNTRQTLIVSFNELCKMKPFTITALIEEDLRNFTQQLIDYVSAGQFQVFETIFAAADHQPEHLQLDKRNVERLLRTTLVALDFNDRYCDSALRLDRLAQDLDSVGKCLADRLDIEDHLIELYAAATTALSKS